MDTDLLRIADFAFVIGTVDIVNRSSVYCIARVIILNSDGDNAARPITYRPKPINKSTA